MPLDDEIHFFQTSTVRNMIVYFYFFALVFLSGQPSAYAGGVLGMAFVGTVCSVASSGGINVVSLTPF